MKTFNYKLGILVLVISLAVFFAGNYFFANYKVNYSLQQDLEQIAGVTEVKITSPNSNHELNLTLEQVTDLQQVFTQVRNRVAESLEPGTYQLEFTVPGEFSSQLETEVELALHEACQTGEFVELGKRIKEYETKYNLQETIIQVDDDYIYLGLVKNEQALYKVINRRRKG